MSGESEFNQPINTERFHLFGALIMTILPTPQFKSNNVLAVTLFQQGMDIFVWSDQKV